MSDEVHTLSKRMVLIEGTKSTAIVRCSCGEVFRSENGMDAERAQFEHMLEKERGR